LSDLNGEDEEGKREVRQIWDMHGFVTFAKALHVFASWDV